MLPRPPDLAQVSPEELQDRILLDRVNSIGGTMLYGTVEPRFNEPLYNEVLGITKDFLQPG